MEKSLRRKRAVQRDGLGRQKGEKDLKASYLQEEEEEGRRKAGHHP